MQPSSVRLAWAQARSASNLNLYASEKEAVALGATFISNSWGNPEYSGETADDSVFDHPGVAITASAGDYGNNPSFPATSNYVTAVGGTTLTPSSNARGWAESAWTSSGAGCSAYQPTPVWQRASTSCTGRAQNDVAAVADPNTGVAVYQTYGASGWQVYGGTSVGAPIIASVYALAGTPAADSTPAAFPYKQPSFLNDVTSGSDGTCAAPICPAGIGWDGPTGLGTPHGVTDFAASPPPPPNTVTVAPPGSPSANLGAGFTLQIHATDSDALQTFGYTATGLPTGLAIDPTTGLITGTPTTLGSSSVTVTATDGTGVSGSTTFTITITPTCVGSQLLGNPGFETGSAAPWTTTTGVISTGGGELPTAEVITLG